MNIKSILTISGLGVLVLLLTGLSIWQWKVARDNERLLNSKVEELQTANLELGRARTTLVDQDKLHKQAMAQLDSKLQEEIKKNKALVSMYIDLEAKYNTEKKRADGLATTLEEVLKTSNTADLTPGTLFYKRNDGLLVEIKKLNWDYKDFRITLEGDMTPEGLKDEKLQVVFSTTYLLHQKFKAKFIQTKTPSGVVAHYAKLFELDDSGKEIGELQLTAFDVQLTNDKLKRSFSWWNPKIDLTAAGAITTKLDGDFQADVGVSLSSWGFTKNDITLRFFRFGVGYMDKNATLSFSPVAYNIGEPIPLVSNLWITPAVGYSFGRKAPYFSLGIGVVF